VTFDGNMSSVPSVSIGVNAIESVVTIFELAIWDFNQSIPIVWASGANDLIRGSDFPGKLITVSCGLYDNVER
jgi:hypothetical protein